MPFARCPSPAEAAAALTGVVGRAGSALFLFFGSDDPETGQSWCPDCLTADPVLRAAIQRLRQDLTCFECPVGLRCDWKNTPEHPYRLAAGFRVARIPTLILFEQGCEVGRLVEADCAKPAAVDAFLGR